MRIAFLHICESRLARRRTGLRRIQGPRAFPTRFLIPSLPSNNLTILRSGPPSPLSRRVHARQKAGSEGPNASKSVQPPTTPKTKPHGGCGRACANLHKKLHAGRALKKLLNYHCRTLQSSRMVYPSYMRNPAHCFIICLGKSKRWQLAFSYRHLRCQGARTSAHPVSNH